MLCRRSASLTRITRMSRAMAMAIFWKFSAWASALVWKSIWVSLLTPSTSSATVSPNCALRASLGMPVSSMTSCSMAAIRL
ncbi:hypothetical protein D3C78_1832060 [compost metagenome]